MGCSTSKEGGVYENERSSADHRQEPKPTDRPVNISNTFGEAGVKAAIGTVLPSVDTGDIALFDISGLINICTPWTKTRYDHCGLFVHQQHLSQEMLDLFPGSMKLKDSELYIIHTTKKLGVRLEPLANVLDGDRYVKVSVRRLHLDRSESMIQSLHQFMKKHFDTEFETDLIEMFRSVYDGVFGRNKEESDDKFFCSEMVARIYQTMGLLKDSSNGGTLCTEMGVRDFTSAVQLNLQLPSDSTGPNGVDHPQLETEVELLVDEDYVSGASTGQTAGEEAGMTEKPPLVRGTAFKRSTIEDRDVASEEWSELRHKVAEIEEIEQLEKEQLSLDSAITKEMIHIRSKVSDDDDDDDILSTMSEVSIHSSRELSMEIDTASERSSEHSEQDPKADPKAEYLETLIIPEAIEGRRGTKLVLLNVGETLVRSTMGRSIDEEHEDFTQKPLTITVQDMDVY